MDNRYKVKKLLKWYSLNSLHISNKPPKLRKTDTQKYIGIISKLHKIISPDPLTLDYYQIALIFLQIEKLTTVSLHYYLFHYFILFV